MSKAELEQQVLQEGLSPEAVEAKMLEKAAKEDPTGSPADKAAAFFQMSAPLLKQLLNQMSLRECQRMIMNVATYPFAGKYNVKRDSIEFKAAYRFNEMVTAKTLMQLEYEREKVTKAMETESTNNNLSLTKGENSNGQNE